MMRARRHPGKRPEASAALPTSEQLERLEALIERLIALRDAFDGDTEMEDDNQDRCEARDDAPRSDHDPINGYQGDGLPGDPDDAEDGGDAESESWTERHPETGQVFGIGGAS